MRFAKIEEFMNQNRPDFGQTAQQAATFRAAEKNAGTALSGRAAAAGINAVGEVEAADIIGAAQASAANSAARGSMWSSLGSIASAGIGTFGQVGTNMGKTQYSQPHASGIGREALGGYDI